MLFPPQPLAARGIVMAMTVGRAGAGLWADQICPDQISALIEQNHSKSEYYLAVVL